MHNQMLSNVKQLIGKLRSTRSISRKENLPYTNNINNETEIVKPEIDAMS